jgi:hypothetical protein
MNRKGAKDAKEHKKKDLNTERAESTEQSSFFSVPSVCSVSSVLRPFFAPLRSLRQLGLVSTTMSALATPDALMARTP